MQRNPGRQTRRAVHGVLLLDKPLGLSSNDALQKAKRLYRAQKAGHTGTLDPLATGLLPLCFGAATKFSEISLIADKAYRATLKLGITTSTADAEGEVLLEREVAASREQIEKACKRFTGEIDQVPPMYSALKRNGKPLYEYARAGITVERESRRVTIHAIDIIEWQHERLVIDVRCSKGTYIRTLAEDIGEALGCGAHLSALRRTGSGALTLNGAFTLEQLAEMSEAERDAALQDADALLPDWPLVRLQDEDASRFVSGMRWRLRQDEASLACPCGFVRVYGPEPRAFLGTGNIARGELIPTRLLSPLERQGLVEPQPQAAASQITQEITSKITQESTT